MGGWAGARSAALNPLVGLLIQTINGLDDECVWGSYILVLLSLTDLTEFVPECMASVVLYDPRSIYSALCVTSTAS